MDKKEPRKVLSTLLKVVEMVGNSISHPKDKKLSLADGHINVRCLITNNALFSCRYGARDPWIGVNIGVRWLELVPSSQDSSLKMWRFEPESRMQRGVKEILVSSLMVNLGIRPLLVVSSGSKIGVYDSISYSFS